MYSDTGNKKNEKMKGFGWAEDIARGVGRLITLYLFEDFSHLTVTDDGSNKTKGEFV